MHVNRVNVLDLINSSADTFNITINSEQLFLPHGNEMVIENEFIPNQINNVINRLEDLDKVQFYPITENGEEISKIIYKLRFKSSSFFPINDTKLSEIGFDDNDILFYKNSYTESILSLLFYDNINLTENILLDNVSLFPDLRDQDIQPYNVSYLNTSIPYSTTVLNTNIVRDNYNNKKLNEGFKLYSSKEKPILGITEHKFMRAIFSNAKNGKQTIFMTKPTPYSINDLKEHLFTKYSFYKDSISNRYYYIINSDQGNTNYDSLSKTMEIILYETQVI